MSHGAERGFPQVSGLALGLSVHSGNLQIRKHPAATHRAQGVVDQGCGVLSHWGGVRSLAAPKASRLGPNTLFRTLLETVSWEWGMEREANPDGRVQRGGTTLLGAGHVAIAPPVCVSV